MSEDTKAVTYEPTGDIVMVLDGEKRTLRYPKYGVYLQIKNQWVKLSEADRERVVLVKDMKSEDNPDPYVQLRRIDELTDEINAGKEQMWRLAFQELSDRPLPEDFGDWPTWLLTAENLANSVLDHWRAVPLVPGG